MGSKTQSELQFDTIAYSPNPIPEGVDMATVAVATELGHWPCRCCSAVKCMKDIEQECEKKRATSPTHFFLPSPLLIANTCSFRVPYCGSSIP